jgi:hypothetical protein
MQIVTSSVQLHRNRKSNVRNLLAPLLSQPPNIAVEQIGFARNRYTLGLIPKNRAPSSIQNPEDAVVTTRVPGVLLNYYEMWSPVEGTDSYSLRRAYMHLHLGRGSAVRQIMALHCDPEMSPSDQHYKYKRGPHLHLEGAQPSVSRAHISLCLLDQQLGGADIVRLTNSMRAAVEMVGSELFPCWERAST